MFNNDRLWTPSKSHPIDVLKIAFCFLFMFNYIDYVFER